MNPETGHGEPRTRACMTDRLNEFVRVALRVWGEDEKLTWGEVVDAVRKDLAMDRPDDAVAVLLGHLATRGEPTSSATLAGKAGLAVKDTVRHFFGRAPVASQPKEVEKENEKEDRDRHIPVTAATRVSAVRDVVSSISAPHEQPLSGTTAGVPLATGLLGFQVSGFAFVSPPPQIPIEYTVLGERYTGLAAADVASMLSVTKTLTFRTPMIVNFHKVDQLRADFAVTFDRQVYCADQVEHVEIRGAELPAPKRLANLTLALTSAAKPLPDDTASLDLSLTSHRDSERGDIVYRIRWTWIGRLTRLVGHKNVDKHGSITVGRKGNLLAEDAATEKHFGLPRAK